MENILLRKLKESDKNLTKAYTQLDAAKQNMINAIKEKYKELGNKRFYFKQDNFYSGDTIENYYFCINWQRINQLSLSNFSVDKVYIGLASKDSDGYQYWYGIDIPWNKLLELTPNDILELILKEEHYSNHAFSTVKKELEEKIKLNRIKQLKLSQIKINKELKELKGDV